MSTIPQETDLITYDIETFPNIFTTGFKCKTTQQRWYFEISPRTNDIEAFYKFMLLIADKRMPGFNNIGFDYPVIHMIMKTAHAGCDWNDIYKKAMSIINAPFNARFANMVYESDWLVEQIDLFKIHHFDNQAKSTSLKVLEFVMRMDSIEDLPFDVGNDLTYEQMSVLRDYMWHDIDATERFLDASMKAIKFREQLTKEHNRSFMNHNDTKIGKDIFIARLEAAVPGCCYRKIDGKKVIQQTPRDSINLADVILPYVHFNSPEFNRILDWFNNKVITETKGAIKDLSCVINGFKFDFGTGGIHGSVESQVIHADDDYIIEDWDVASYYPNLAIVNGFRPAHLGDTFNKVYKELYDERRTHAKGTVENAALKLALNGSYGDSNSQYSPLYDPQFTMAITINGQLSLCMLAEQLMSLFDLQMIQINTDGLTIKYPRAHKEWVHSVCKWWEDLTKLELEVVEYSRFMVRDVNNYIAEYVGGDLKRKGAYEYDRDWHQNHSALIVPRAAEAALVYGKDIREFIMDHDDIFDFMLLAKVPRSNILKWGDEIVQNTSRYYVSTDGDTLEKVAPPKDPVGAYKRANKLTDDYYNEIVQELTGKHPLLDEIDWCDVPWDERINTKNKSKYEDVVTGIEAGWTVQVCNDMKQFKDDINYEYYIQRAEKLVNLLLD